MSRRTQIILKRESCDMPYYKGKKLQRKSSKNPGRAWTFIIKWADGGKTKANTHYIHREEARRKAENVVAARESKA